MDIESSYLEGLDKAFSAGKLGTGRLAKRKLKNLQFAARVPFVLEMVRREFGDPVTGLVDWDEIPWEDILAFIEAIIELLLKFGLI